MRHNKPRFRMRLRRVKVRRRRQGVEITAGYPASPAFFFKKRSLNDLKR
ncbi:MAG: hypothetical protein V1792_11315 [Pseudomonadota bacterium]